MRHSESRNSLRTCEELRPATVLQEHSKTTPRFRGDPEDVTHTPRSTGSSETAMGAVIPFNTVPRNVPRPGSRSYARWSREAEAGARTTLRDLIDSRAAANLGPAFIEGLTDREIRWSEIAARTTQWTELVEREQIPPSARIGLLVADPLGMAAAFLATLTSGRTTIPLDPNGMPSELAEQCARLEVSEVIACAESLGANTATLAADGLRIWALDDQGLHLAAGSPALPGKPHAAPQGTSEVALILSSSGTTGTPKLMPLRLDSLLDCANGVVAHNSLNPEDRGYSPLPLFHINGLIVGIVAALLGGYSLVLDRRFSASRFWEVADRHGVTWINIVPAIISLLAHRPAPPAQVSERVRFARSASAPLPLATLDRFEQLTGIVILETYGMTECASQITANPRPPAVRKPGSVGVPVDLELRVTDEKRHRVAPGVVGSVEVRGRRIVTEYWAPAGSEERSRPALDSQGWLTTGDIGYLDVDGYLFLAGRSDDVINRGGEKVYPREIEEVLLNDPGVDVAAAVGKPDPVVGEVPVVFIIATEGTDPEQLTARLEDKVEHELSRFRRPTEIHVVNSLPSGTNGKIKRSEIRRALLAAES